MLKKIIFILKLHQISDKGQPTALQQFNLFRNDRHNKIASSFYKIILQKHMKTIRTVIVVHKIHAKRVMDQIEGEGHWSICT